MRRRQQASNSVPLSHACCHTHSQLSTSRVCFQASIKKAFLYELHVAEAARRRGVGRALIDFVKTTTASRGRGDVIVELIMHEANMRTRGPDSFYTTEGFGKTGATRGGLALIFSRKRYCVGGRGNACMTYIVSYG